jgi:hypothetical protein
MSSDRSISEMVAQLAKERPGWLVVLRACCVVARGADVLELGFAGSWVRQQLENGVHQTRSGPRVWLSWRHGA